MYRIKKDDVVVEVDTASELCMTLEMLNVAHFEQDTYRRLRYQETNRD